MEAHGGDAPNPARLQAAIDRVVSRLDPDQIILFGSGVRKEMTGDSDLDLLVITEPPPDKPGAHREHWEARDGETYDIDLILMSRATAEAGRHSTTRIQGIALEEGRTVYTRNGLLDPIGTGPTYVWNGCDMVKKTRFEPEEATRLLGHAEEHWRFAQDPETTPSMRCIQLQASMEHALKALIIAQGERVRHKHTLNDLWDDVEQRGERINAVQDRKVLDVLTAYGGRLQYDEPRPEEDPTKTWEAARTGGGDVLNHAKSRVAQLIVETTERLQAQDAAGRRRNQPAKTSSGSS